MIDMIDLVAACAMVLSPSRSFLPFSIMLSLMAMAMPSSKRPRGNRARLRKGAQTPVSINLLVLRAAIRACRPHYGFVAEWLVVEYGKFPFAVH